MQFSNLVQNQSGAQRIELRSVSPTFAAVATVWAATYQGVTEMQQWANFICAAVNACRAINPDNPLAAANALADAVAALEGLVAAMDKRRPPVGAEGGYTGIFGSYEFDGARKALAALKGGEQ